MLHSQSASEFMRLLEVIVCSVDDADQAQQGGAHRLEVVTDLPSGGLTPPWELVQQIKRTVDLPLRVMLRESTGFAVSGENEITRLCVAAERFATLEVDGFVLGFLKAAAVDLELTQRVLACAPHVPATFHHAFEDAEDKSRALREIKQLPQIDRVLSHGGTDELNLRIQRLAQYDKAAAPELTIIAGGGIDGDAIIKIGRETQIREFHVGRAARAQFQVGGDVQSALVATLVKKLNEI